MKKDCNPDCDREQLDKLIDEFIQRHGHEVIRDMYRINKFIRNRMYTNKFPIAAVYRKSLGLLIMDGEYKGLNATQLCKVEPIGKGLAHRIIVQNYRSKKKN